MTTAIAKTNDKLDVLSEEQLTVLRSTIAKNATDSEFSMFVSTCKRLGLDPFARQIFLVKRFDPATRSEPMTPQVSIDGLRLVAERTRQYRGQTVPQWCGADGKWVDVWLSDSPPAAARVGVYREGFEEPLVRVARYASYVQMTRDKQSGDMRPNATWAKMADVMLSKCAESLALRSAFPNELSGVYTVDELPEPEQRSPVRTQKQARSLDDVAVEPALAIPADAQETKHDVETGEVIYTAPSIDYTKEQHLAALSGCSTVAQLTQWFEMMKTFELSKQERATAWMEFGKQCLDYDIDPDQFRAKKEGK